LIAVQKGIAEAAICAPAISKGRDGLSAIPMAPDADPQAGLCRTDDKIKPTAVKSSKCLATIEGLEYRQPAVPRPYRNDGSHLSKQPKVRAGEDTTPTVWTPE
jgi:hypothetical protein